MIELDRYIINTKILSKFEEDKAKMWFLERKHDFIKI